MACRKYDAVPESMGRGRSVVSPVNAKSWMLESWKEMSTQKDKFGERIPKSFEPRCSKLRRASSSLGVLAVLILYREEHDRLEACALNRVAEGGEIQKRKDAYL